MKIDAAMLPSRLLLKTDTLVIRDVRCPGGGRHAGEEERADGFHVVFPYRGVFVRHRGGDEVVAEPNQVVLFGADEPYRVSHPVEGGDGCLSIALDEHLLGELAPKDLRRAGPRLAFRAQRLRIDPRAQVLAALLRHSLAQGVAEPLEAEGLALTLVHRALGERTRHLAGASAGRQALVDRVKLVLASDLSRRWTLADIAAEVRGSPVYLTQVFQQVEGVPLYRYQLRLRLARALDLLAECDDLTTVALDLGFSSHSHFGSAFRTVYGRSPSAFQKAARAL